MNPPRFTVMLDDVPYSRKPDNWGAVTNRLKRAKPAEIDAAQLCAHIRAGKCWMPGVYEGGRFVSMQLLVLDFDNDISVGKDEHGKEIKRQLWWYEPGYISPAAAVARSEALGLLPLSAYETFSCVNSERMRFRLVIYSPRACTDESEAKRALAGLLRTFPEADGQCSNPNRIFAGTNGGVGEHWRAWDE